MSARRASLCEHAVRCPICQVPAGETCNQAWNVEPVENAVPHAERAHDYQVLLDLEHDRSSALIDSDRTPEHETDAAQLSAELAGAMDELEGLKREQLERTATDFAELLQMKEKELFLANEKAAAMLNAARQTGQAIGRLLVCLNWALNNVQECPPTSPSGWCPNAVIPWEDDLRACEDLLCAYLPEEEQLDALPRPSECVE